MPWLLSHTKQAQNENKIIQLAGKFLGIEIYVTLMRKWTTVHIFIFGPYCVFYCSICDFCIFTERKSINNEMVHVHKFYSVWRSTWPLAYMSWFYASITPDQNHDSYNLSNVSCDKRCPCTQLRMYICNWKWYILIYQLFIVIKVIRP